VFTTTFDGKVYAFNKTTGAPVWSYQAPGGINAWPAFAGDYMLLPVGLGYSFPVLMAFKLGASAPALTIKPDNGATVTSGNVTISAMAFKFNIVDKQGQANAAGEGHLHYFMDVDAPTTPGTPAIPSSGTWVHTTANSYTFTNVAPGTHTFSVELVNNDHTPLNPPVVQKITVNVQAPGPALKTLLPQNRSTMQAGNVTITVQVANFNLVASPGTGTGGEGHLIYYMDVVAPITAGQAATTATGTYYETADTSYTWMNVPAGTHTFTVQLVNDDGTPLNPPVTDKVVVITSISAAGGP
jgi:hypothetical protein